MAVCCRYKTILQRIEAELLLKFQTHLHALANKASLEGTAGRLAWLAGVQHLSKGALFIRGTDTQRALLRTFDLENLGQRFTLLSQAPVILALLLAIPGITRISQPPGLIRVVGYGKEITAIGLITISFQTLPEFDRIGYIKAGNGPIRHNI